MKAAVATENGLEIRHILQPRPKPFELLVKVKAAGLNRADLAAARAKGGHGSRGHHDRPRLGWRSRRGWSEIKGGFKAGDRVCARARADTPNMPCAIGGASCHIPGGMTFEHAATLPVALGTMHDALVTNGRFKSRRERSHPGREFRGRSDGVADCQAAGCKLVIGTSTNADRRARLGDFGADLAVDTKDPNGRTSC